MSYSRSLNRLEAWGDLLQPARALLHQDVYAFDIGRPRGDTRLAIARMRLQRSDYRIVEVPLAFFLPTRLTRAQLCEEIVRVASELAGMDVRLAADVSPEQQPPSEKAADTEGLFRLRFDDTKSIPDDENTEFAIDFIFQFDVVWNVHLEKIFPELAMRSARRPDDDGSLSSNTRGAVTLNACLSVFAAQEQLGKDEAWYCPSCKTFVQAFKNIDLWRLPEILVVHLKRFTQRFRKIETFVDFPLRGLDLTDFVVGPGKSERPIYDLFAVSNHSGSLSFGHCTLSERFHLSFTTVINDCCYRYGLRHKPNHRSVVRLQR